MKKLLTLLIIIITACTIYLYFPLLQSYLPSSRQAGPAIVKEETTVTTEAPQETSQLVQDVQAPGLFMEKLVTEGGYPLSSVPNKIADPQELLNAIDLYYSQTYTDDEKAMSQDRISKNDLLNVEQIINEKDSFKSLQIKVDQVSMVLEDQVIYVPRLIFPVSYQNAQRILPDNDIIILNDAMTHFGNRLIMIGYYDPQNEQVTIFHLTNWTKPLFSYSED